MPRTGRPIVLPCIIGGSDEPDARAASVYHDWSHSDNPTSISIGGRLGTRPVGLGNSGFDGYDRADERQGGLTPRRDRQSDRPSVTEDGMKLLALVESPDHVCCRYRIRPSRRPSASGLVVDVRGPGSRRRCFGSCSLAGRRNSTPWSSSASCCRPGSCGILRRSSRHLVFDFDDAVSFRDSYDPRGQDEPLAVADGSPTVMRWPTRSSPATISSPTAPCEPGRRVERVHVIPTCVDPRLYPVARSRAR